MNTEQRVRHTGDIASTRTPVGFERRAVTTAARSTLWQRQTRVLFGKGLFSS